MPSRPASPIPIADILAGLSVALVLIPQALAYSELAGLPAFHGLYAAALPPIAAAFVASSPYLQTGPTALTSILTLGILASAFTPGSPEYVAAAALLALVVSVVRVAVGALRFGGIAYFMSQPVLQGFTSAAGVLILASQLPTALGVSAPSGSTFGQLGWTLTHPAAWSLPAVALSLATLVLVLGGKRLSPFFPGVLIAVLVGLGASAGFGYDGPVIGDVRAGLPALQLAFPWRALPGLLIGGAVIAVVGFAEPTAIARTYAQQSRERWNPNREFIGQGLANIASGLVGGFPVGGSFSRSSLNKLAGATSRWSGLVTGLVVLAFLPFAGLVASLPKAVLGAVVIAAVVNLIRPGRLLRLWRYARLQALTAYGTFALTLALAPRIDYAILVGVALAIGAHLYRETQLGIRRDTHQEDGTLTLVLSGNLWFGSSSQLDDALREVLDDPPAALIIDAGGLGRVDLSGAMLIQDFMDDAESRGVPVDITGLKPHMRRVFRRLERR